MNGRSIARLILVVVLVIGAIGLGVGAYDAGVSAGLAQNGNITVAPGYAVGPYVGWGWGFGHGFGFFGFFGGFLFLILLFALLRAAFGGGRHHGWDGRGGRGPWRSGWQDGEGRSGWEDRAREVHDAWHRDHPGETDRPASPSGGPGGGAV
jgi:hypothetical protein